MKTNWLFKIALVFSLSLSACGPSTPNPTPLPVGGDKPCIGGAVPAQWHHIVVLMFENQHYNDVIGNGRAPYITSLAQKCATAPVWMDADTKVDGSLDGRYNSKPNYATLTNGVPPSVHGLVDDTYSTKTDVNNIYNQLKGAGLPFKDYYEAQAGGCNVRFSGDYHDAIRYYSDVANICNDHDVPLSTFMTDVNNETLPAFSMMIPLKDHTMHDGNIQAGDQFAKSILDPLLNSPAYARGDLAIFFLWDEDAPIPNILMAPSIAPGTQISVSQGNPISHYSALRTWEEMLNLPLIGDTQAAPSLLPFFNHATLLAPTDADPPSIPATPTK